MAGRSRHITQPSAEAQRWAFKLLARSLMQSHCYQAVVCSTSSHPLPADCGLCPRAGRSCGCAAQRRGAGGVHHLAQAAPAGGLQDAAPAGGSRTSYSTLYCKALLAIVFAVPMPQRGLLHRACVVRSAASMPYLLRCLLLDLPMCINPAACALCLLAPDAGHAGAMGSSIQSGRRHWAAAPPAGPGGSGDAQHRLHLH